MKSEVLKSKIRREMTEYALNVVYLAIVFAAFTEYRRLLLAAYDITYTSYWVPVIEAMVLGKVIMIGSVFRLGRGLESKPLIFATLYKTTVFCILLAVVKLIEHGVRGIWHGEGFLGGAAEFFENRLHEVLANTLVVFVALFPFFAVKELGRVLGEQKISLMFFRRQSGTAEDSASKSLEVG